jgi:demethylmenaquinone methyltransferase/2-methoxy-6-polyprenyl-1,4-benzoquinol methylase
LGSDTGAIPPGPVLGTSPIAYLEAKDPMSRYTHSASWYDTLSAEPIYRAGRERAIPALRLRDGSRVLDIGCGTGLNFPLLLAAVGPRGQVVGVDRSREMLEVARRKTIHLPPGNVALVEADAEQIDYVAVGLDGCGATFDAVLFTYSLSLMSNWEAAWLRATSLVRPGGRAAIVDMESPRGWARLLDPAARLACLLAGADINARPWTLLERTAHDVQSWGLCGGHVQVRVGTL